LQSLCRVGHRNWDSATVLTADHAKFFSITQAYESRRLRGASVAAAKSI
jgi:hypothetical protein